MTILLLFSFSMKSFQNLLPGSSAPGENPSSGIDKSPKINEIKKAAHDLLWKYLRGHVKREQTLQVGIISQTLLPGVPKSFGQ